MLVVGTQPAPLPIIAATTRRSTASAPSGSGAIRLQAGRSQVRQRHPGRVAHGGVPSGQRHRRKVPDPLDRGVGPEQQLAAPDRAVVPIAGAVEGEPEHRLAHRPRMLGQQRGEMRVVVLHQQDSSPRRLRPLARPAVRQVPRMQVGHHRLRSHPSQRAEHVDRAFQRLQGRQRADVAEVLGEPRALARCHADGRLQLAADGQQRRRRERQAHG